MSELEIRDGDWAFDLEEDEDSPLILEPFDIDHLIPTGCTLLNCACSGHHVGGFAKGKLVNVIGDSFTGKTLLALSVFAELALNFAFKDYRFIFDDVEAAMEFNVAKLFGKGVLNRMEVDIVSSTIESFYTNFFKAIRDGRPFIYVLDSFDALTSEAEEKRIIKDSKVQAKDTNGPDDDGKKKGSYKTEKPKLVSELLRVTSRDLKQVEGLLIVVSQTRDNIGNKFNPKTRSGGKALKFYSCHEMWLAHMRTLWWKRTIEIGADVGVKLSKNKLTGKRRRISFPIYDDYGIYDIMANVEFLIEEGHWKKAPDKKQIFIASEFKKTGTKQALIHHIEKEGYQKPTQELVGIAWNNLENKVKERTNRPLAPKYQ